MNKEEYAKFAKQAKCLRIYANRTGRLQCKALAAYLRAEAGKEAKNEKENHK